MNSTVLLLRRYFVCAAFVLLWMALEHGLRLSAIGGQLIGIPLIAAFQWLVARRPLTQLWVFDATAFRLDRRTVAIAAALLVVAGGLLAVSRWPGVGRDGRLELLALVAAAAIPAALAWRHQRAANLRRALPYLLVALAFRVAWQLTWHPEHPWPHVSPQRLADFATIAMCETVGLFLVDEVAFRGALDPYLAGAAPGRLHEWCSAIFVSMLWAIWHLPAYNPGAKSFLALFGQLNAFSLGIVAGGVLLSFIARRSRTLLPSAAFHAASNAYVLTLLR